MRTPDLHRGNRARAALVALALSLVPSWPAPAATLPELSPVPRSSRFT